MSTMVKRHIPSSEVCARIGWSWRTLSRKWKAGLFPAPVIGSQGRNYKQFWSLDEVERWLEEQRMSKLGGSEEGGQR
jgi:hypothetical protein